VRSKVQWFVLVALCGISAVLLTVVVFTPAPFFFGLGGNFWRGLIYDFQTLIAGVFAVVAAAWTVITMERTDASAGIRHEELVKFQQLPIRRALERIKTKSLSRIAEAAEDLASLPLPKIEDFEKLRMIGKPSTWPEGDVFGESLLRDMLIQLQSDAWLEFRPYVGGKAMLAITKLEEAIGECQASAAYLWMLASQAREVPHNDEKNKNNILELWRVSMHGLSLNLQNLADLVGKIDRALDAEAI